MTRLHPYVTLMVGRLDDHLQRVLTKEAVSIDPGYLHWAGIAVFKKAGVSSWNAATGAPCSPPPTGTTCIGPSSSARA